MSSIFPHRILCYINGVRIDVSSVSVSAERNGYQAFTVSAPGIPEWDILPPRSVGTVFYADPVSGRWRLLVEGEYIAYSKVKTAAGARHVSLSFRGFHAIFESSRNVALGAGMNPQGGSIIPRQLELVVNSRALRPSGANKLDMPNTAALFATVANQSSTAAEFFPQIVQYVLSQLPVEAYYLYERRLVEKIFAFKDVQLGTTIDVKRLRAMTTYMARTFTDENETLGNLIRRFEELLMYQHIPMLAPPVYGNIAKPDAANDQRGTFAASLRIPSLFFSPILFNVIPPACNVIFADQLQHQSRAHNFATEPTRVMTKLTSGVGQDLPKLHVATSVVSSVDAARELVSEYPGSNPSAVASHVHLSTDEMERGVLVESVPVGIEYLATDLKGKSTGELQSGDSVTSSTHFWDQTTRHYYATVIGAHRTADLTCVFLPNLVVGAPCLVEDATGPFHGYIESVSHILSNESPPQTTVRVSQVRPALIRAGIDVTPPLPSWLNSMFWPSGVKGSPATNGETTGGVWSKMLGNNAMDAIGGVKHAAMLPEAQITTHSVAENVGSVSKLTPATPSPVVSEQVNMDELAGQVVPVYRFSDKLEFIDVTSGTIADQLRAKPDPLMAMAAYNWRPGMSISEYIRFHQLSASQTVTDMDSVNTGRPPDTMFAISDFREKASPFFAAPIRLKFTGAKGMNDDGTPNVGGIRYGGYELERVAGLLYNPSRQQAMLTIQAALNRHITKS